MSLVHSIVRRLVNDDPNKTIVIGDRDFFKDLEAEKAENSNKQILENADYECNCSIQEM